MFSVFEQQHILNKIEHWIDKLPYQSAKVEIVMKNQTLTLEKNKQNPIGFQIPKERGENRC